MLENDKGTYRWAFGERETESPQATDSFVHVHTPKFGALVVDFKPI